MSSSDRAGGYEVAHVAFTTELRKIEKGGRSWGSGMPRSSSVMASGTIKQLPHSAENKLLGGMYLRRERGKVPLRAKKGGAMPTSR